MNRIAIALATLVLAVPVDAAMGQTLNARRTGMGGVVLPSGGAGSDAGNVAYRAVPRAHGSSSVLPLPIGLIPLISDPPVLDPDDPEFNIYKLANTLYNPPFNLQLVEPVPPSNDVVVAIGRNHLSVQLGEISSLFPEDHSRLGAVGYFPALGFGFRNVFVSASAVAQYDNDLSMNPALHGVLAHGESFETSTGYALYDDVVGQAAGMIQLGWAGAVFKTGQPRASGGSGLYVGARTKLMRGLAYGDARNTVMFSTRDTLFSSAPINLEYAGTTRTAGPEGGGWGRGLDLGLVWVSNRFEVGVGIDDVASRLEWRVEESVAFRDSVTDDFVREVIAEDVPFTSELPRRSTANASVRLGRSTIAGDVVRSMDRTLAHLGTESWLGPIALRTGCSLDANRQIQYAGGTGLKLGRFGVDVAIATHSRNLSHERGVELAAGLALYR
jgi:hypothetical protein